MNDSGVLFKVSRCYGLTRSTQLPSAAKSGTTILVSLRLDILKLSQSEIVVNSTTAGSKISSIFTFTHIFLVLKDERLQN